MRQIRDSVYTFFLMQYRVNYTGETSRTLKNRTRERKGCYQKQYEVTLHIRNQNHTFKIKNIRISDRKKNNTISEYFFIHSNNDNINIKTNTF